MLGQIRKKAASVIALADTFPDAILSRFGIDRHTQYLFSEVAESISRIDGSVKTRAEAIADLRALGLEYFGYLLCLLPDARFQNLSRLLPLMPSAEVQRHWNGRSGVALLKATTNFARLLAHNYGRVTGKPLTSESRVLDYGCGWGRVSRAMYYYVDEHNLFGVDPWDKSIELCKSHGLGGNFLQSDYVPTTLPVSGQFDLIYAYSVFTHLAERPTLAALNTMRKYVRDDGVLAITVRPVEYWDLTRYIDTESARRFSAQHRNDGFAFYPHPGEHNNNTSEVVYGDTSISLDWIERQCPQWKVAMVDRTFSDRLQTYIYLTPK